MKLYKISDVDGLDFYTHTIKHEIGATLHCADWNSDPSIDCGEGLHACEMIDQIFDIMGAKPCRVWIVDISDENCVKSSDHDKWRFNDGMILDEIPLDGLVSGKYHFVMSGKHADIKEGIWCIGGEAQVSRVYGEARVSRVYGEAQVSNVYGNAVITIFEGYSHGVGFHNITGKAIVIDYRTNPPTITAGWNVKIGKSAPN